VVYVISGFCYNADEMCALLGCSAPYRENSLAAFWGNLLVPSAMVKKHLKMGLTDCLKASVRNYHY
jgi:hypothetical protein